MEMMLWNVILSLIVGVMMILLKGKMEEIGRISLLLVQTREEMARNHISRQEVDVKIERIFEKFDSGFARLENKIDELARNQTNHNHNHSYKDE